MDTLTVVNFQNDARDAMQIVAALADYVADHGGVKDWTYPVVTQPPASKPMYGDLGIDVALWQAGLPWEAVRDAGVKFAFIKGSQNNAVDPQFIYHRQGARRVGIPWGCTHYFCPETDAKYQADAFAAVSQGAPLDLAADVERVYPQIGKPEYAKRLLVFLERVEEITGRRPIIYSNHYLDGFIGVPDWLKTYRFWFAGYPFGARLPGRGEILLHSLDPAPGSGPIAYWQYSSVGVIPGWKGDIDFDICLEKDVIP